MARWDTIFTAEVIHSQEPLNAETPGSALVRSRITPDELFFARNHGPVPQIELSDYAVVVEGMVETPRTYDFDTLLSEFESISSECTLQCAGNRRDELDRLKAIVGEIPWGFGAIGNAVWEGVRLADVLKLAGVQLGAKHVWFEGADAVQEGEKTIPFGGSVPLDVVNTRDVLLAYKMSGKTLTPARGFPLRAIVPGYMGARSIKWLSKITVSDKESPSKFQQYSYKISSENGAIDWAALPAVGDIPVTSAICEAKVVVNEVALSGYAYSGAGHIAKVEVSENGSWVPANISGTQKDQAWILWNLSLTLSPGKHNIKVRATDSTGATQPSKIQDVWNVKGYLNNAQHEIEITIEGA